jgi:hypothetical protein
MCSLRVVEQKITVQSRGQNKGCGHVLEVTLAGREREISGDGFRDPGGNKTLAEGN